MTRRYESLLASSALLLLLALALFYGCRAFDPEPVIVNRPPDTFITGAPAETTGTRFLRHMYWYGTDVDGEVVRYIWAVTDSTVRDTSRPDEDEEDARFNPALDVTTLEPIPGRIIGYTTQTDSLFLFDVDRGSTPSKDITFHIVSVDDRGAMDPTPARLHFLNNSLGNPILRFSVYTFEPSQRDGPPDTWVLRWVGTPEAPILGISPEATSRPFVGFNRKFRIEWEASSPNGAVIGFRYKASQDARVPFTPPTEEGVKQWGDPEDPAYQQYVYENDQPPENFLGCDPRSGENCPPELIRWPSDDYVLRVQALDVALVESEAAGGELTFEVNYPPSTEIQRSGGYPHYELKDSGGGTVTETFAPGDTIPDGAYATFQMSGFDRRLSSLPPDVTAGYGPLCCDVVFDAQAPPVLYQGQTKLVGDEGFRTRRFQTLYSTSSPLDTLGFAVGPFQYTFLGRTEDEHGRRDPDPDSFEFVGGFRPRLTEIYPSFGDSLILRWPNEGYWPENNIPYTLPTTEVPRYWDGAQYFESAGEGRIEIRGYVFHLKMRFVGAADERDPLQPIRGWTFAMFTERDPNNVIVDGRESSDLSFFVDSPEENRWEFGDDDAVEIFVPTALFLQPQDFDWDSDVPERRQAGQLLHARQLGEITLKVQGRTTSTTTPDFRLYQEVRPGGDGAFVPIDIKRMGRRTRVAEVKFHIFVGCAPFGSQQIQRLWPDKCTFEGGPPRDECRLSK